METEKIAFVIYNLTLGFRSSRSSHSYKPKFAKAVLYTMRHHAVNASTSSDLIIPVYMKLDPGDLFMSILEGTEDEKRKESK